MTISSGITNTSTVPATVAGTITPTTPVSPALGCAMSVSTYVYSTAADLYSATIPAALGKNVTVGLTVPPKAIATNQVGLTSSTDRSFDRNINWRDIEQSAGNYTWAALDAWVAATFAAGKDMIYVVFGTPAFYTSSVDNSQSTYGIGSLAFPDLNLPALGAFMTALVSRYKAKGTPIKYVEIWNEPKYVSGNSSFFVGTPTQLAQIARAAVSAAKAVDSTILALSTSPTGLEYAWVLNDSSGSDYLYRYLTASDGASGTGRTWTDIVAVHTYGHSGYNNEFSIPQIATNIKAVLNAITPGLTLPYWATETSAITPQLTTLSLQDQKNYIARSLVLHAAAGFSRVIWYGFGSLGPSDTGVQAAWNSTVSLLTGATLGPVNYALTGANGLGTWDWQAVGAGNTYGTVWATINGTQYSF